MSNNNPIPNNRPFKKGQSGNPNGRPKKLYARHLDDIKAMGYVPPTKPEFMEMVGLLMAMSEGDLQTFAKDKERPYWIRVIIFDLTTKLGRQRLMDSYRDWLFGKAEQTHNVELPEQPIFIGIDLSVKED